MVTKKTVAVLKYSYKEAVLETKAFWKLGYNCIL